MGALLGAFGAWLCACTTAPTSPANDASVADSVEELGPGACPTSIAAYCGGTSCPSTEGDAIQKLCASGYTVCDNGGQVTGSMIDVGQIYVFTNGSLTFVLSFMNGEQKCLAGPVGTTPPIMGCTPSGPSLCLGDAGTDGTDAASDGASE